jgi:hypothetical protein
VFILTSHTLPPLKLQPTEVGSTHWVPLSNLLHPSLRTYEHCDVSDRLAKRGGYSARIFLRSMLGQMIFSAVKLVPAESMYCSFSPGILPDAYHNEQGSLSSVLRTVKNWLIIDHASSPSLDRPLLLWGLTLGVVTDFLYLLPPHNALRLWEYPTFTPVDVRFIIWIMTLNHRLNKWSIFTKLEFIKGHRTIVSSPEGEEGPIKRVRFTSSAVGMMLEGYYDIVRRAVMVSVAMRVFLGSGIFAILLRRNIRALRRR